VSDEQVETEAILLESNTLALYFSFMTWSNQLCFYIQMHFCMKKNGELLRSSNNRNLNNT
jgi:hypothetical protein